MKSSNLILIRHGQSLWNQKNLFTGWTDIDLSEKGIEEAKQAGQSLKNKNISLDRAFTSALTRAISTVDYILKELELEIPTSKHWQLNERHYGALQGQNKKELVEKYGKETIQKWRRDFDTQPPALKKPQELTNKELYKDLATPPLTESLKDTQDRVLPFWKQTLLPAIQKGESILIGAHGNSLRALIKYLEKISDEDISSLEIQTGKPIIYSIDDKETILTKEVM